MTPWNPHVSANSQDIEFWVDEKLQFSSLTQRFGRAGSDPRLGPVGIIFAARNVLSSTQKWNEDLGKWVRYMGRSRVICGIRRRG
jgi:hypothetical protein